MKTASDSPFFHLCVERAEQMTTWDYTQINNTLILYNYEFAEIDFKGLYRATDRNFAHDIYGIVKAVKERDRYFLPRYAVNQ